MEIWMKMARDVAGMSLCPRLQVGCVITDQDRQVLLASGHNGTCVCDGTEGDCGCVHAEMDALVSLRRSQTGLWLFCTHSPCRTCARLILRARISHVVYETEYRDTAGIDFLHRLGVPVLQWPQRSRGTDARAQSEDLQPSGRSAHRAPTCQ